MSGLHVVAVRCLVVLFVPQVGLVSGMTDQARRVLRSMTRREVRIKIFLAFFILLMLVLIGVIIYFVFIK